MGYSHTVGFPAVYECGGIDTTNSLPVDVVPLSTGSTFHHGLDLQMQARVPLIGFASFDVGLSPILNIFAPGSFVLLATASCEFAL